MFSSLRMLKDVKGKWQYIFLFSYMKELLRACLYGQKLSRVTRNFSTSQILLFSLYGETLSRLPGKVFGCDVTLNIN
jgi:hypothetical protein